MTVVVVEVVTVVPGAGGAGVAASNGDRPKRARNRVNSSFFIAMFSLQFEFECIRLIRPPVEAPEAI